MNQLAPLLANALPDRGDCHRQTGGVTFPLAPDTQMILHCAVHTPQGNLGPATRQTGDLLQITKYRVAADATAHWFPQVSELLEAKSAPRAAPQERAAPRFTVRIMTVTWVGGAMGIRTPDLLHAMKR
jgi:hypothetical protein